MSLTLAIVGRPNVGKSTLFNRLVGKKLALVDDRPGVTRDRREGKAKLGGLSFQIIDTAGLDEAKGDQLIGAMRAQTDKAIDDADVILFMVDARAGLLPLDQTYGDLLRKSDKPVILAVNKCEGRAGQPGLLDAYSLGLGEPLAMSAEHGEGLGLLFDVLQPFFEADQEKLETQISEEDKPLSLAIIGRPNAGKSTLINQLLGEDRLIVGPQAGMTRDAIAVDWHFNGRPIKLVDTAGMRKRARVNEKLEKLSVADALRAINYAEVVVLVIDALKPFDKQDLQIADLVAREGRALVIAVNKWDLVKDKRALRKMLDEEVERLLPQMRGVQLIALSALTAKGTARLMPAVLKIYDIWNKRVPTRALNNWLEGAVARHNPPASRGRAIKLRYMTQAKARPPTFIVFCSKPDKLPTSYSRYLVNELRREFDFPAVPIRLHLRKGDNPYADKKK